MTLRVKGHPDTSIVGVLSDFRLIRQITALDDEGYPILGEVVIDPDAEEEAVIREGSLVFVDTEGGEYSGSNVIEDVREDGSVVPYTLVELPRVVTAELRENWKVEVNAYQTTLGLHDWIEELTEARYFALHGLLVDHTRKSREEALRIISARFQGIE